MSRLLGMLALLSRLQRQGPGRPGLLPIPMQLPPLTAIPLSSQQGLTNWLTSPSRQDRLRDWMTGQDEVNRAEAAEGFRRDAERLARIQERQQAVNERSLARFQAQQDRFLASQQGTRGVLTGLGVGQLEAGAGGLANGPLSIGSLGRGLGNLLGGAGMIAGVATGNPAIGVATSTMGAFAGAVAESIDKLQTWSRALLNSNFQIGQFSPAMAQVEAMQKLNDILFSQEAGDRLAPTTQNLVDSYERARQTFKEPYLRSREFINFAGAEALEGVADMGEGNIISATARLNQVSSMGILGGLHALNAYSTMIIQKGLQTLGRPFRHQDK